MENQTAWNNDPLKQPKDVPSIQKTDPRNDVNSDNPNTVQHQVIHSADSKKEGGKDIGLVNAPIQSINPTSAGQSSDAAPKKKDYKIIDNANQHLNLINRAPDDFKYQFDELDIGQGIFVPVEQNQTTDQLMADVHDQINYYREQNSECEKDKNGDDVWESVVIQTKKYKDGVVQLDGLGKPIVGANQTNRPKLIYAANFIARAVVNGDEIGEDEKADSDGVLIVRVL